MKRWFIVALIIAIMLVSTACSPQDKQQNITATTMPVYTFTKALCQGAPINVQQLVQENVSCLHDYTLTVRHMKMLESSDMVVISGGGLEGFLEDALPDGKLVLDASTGIDLHCHDTQIHDEHGHQHDQDPHFWLSIEKANQMAHTICDGLKTIYPQYERQFSQNIASLDESFAALQAYATDNLSDLKNKDIITFHDGFSYMAEDFGLTILKAFEEESGSEISAKDLIEICNLVTNHSLPCVFTEKNGSTNAATVICNETGVNIYCLDMAMSGDDYFKAMYYNIDTLKEALG